VKRLAIEYWLPLILWLVVIFIFSTDYFSSARTSSVIVSILHFLFPSRPLHQLEFWHAVIRKIGHVTEYFLLAVFTYRTMKLVQLDWTQAKVRTMGFVLFAASFDELHQAFTLFRTPSPFDVGYDCLGAVWALSLITIYEIWRLRTHPVL
jgi:VanZ family protein